MASFSSFFITKKFPSPTRLRSLLHGSLTAVSAMVYGLFVALCITIFILLITLNNKFLVTVPARGGNLTEGVVGALHFINPLLATTDTDNRLVALVYSNLMKEIDSYTVSPDGKIYTVTLLPDIRFDDGKALTSGDVVFTVQKMQNATISNTSDYWENISVENPTDQRIVFTLPAPDTNFLSHLSFAVLPKHIWGNISDESFDTAKQNLKPVGAGPFKVSDIIYENDLPTTVVLSRNKYAITTPLLRTLTITSFANQSELFDALNNGDIDFSYALSPDMAVRPTLNKHLQKQSIATTNTVNIYHSTKDTTLGNTAIVSTISQIIDKNAIIDTVLHGYGTPLGGLSNTTTSNTSPVAHAIADKIKKVPGFSIAVENDPSLLLAAQTFAQQLQSAGISVSVKAFDPGTFQKNITAGTFSLFLARENDMTIPQQYTVVVALYTENEPYIFNTNTHTTVPDTVESPMMEYSSVTDWYSRTDKLWKWQVHKDTKN